MSGDSERAFEGVETAALVRGLSLGAALLSVGLALARMVPAESPAWLAVSAAIVLLAMNLVADWLARSRGPAPRSDDVTSSRWIMLAAPLLAGFAWAPAGSATTCVVLVLVGLTALALELSRPALLACWIKRRSGLPVVSCSTPAATAASLEGLEKPAAHALDRSAGVREPMVEFDATSTSDAVILQQWTRETEAGCERLRGSVRIAFAANERHTVFHLPIAPPLGASPEVECEPLDDAPVEVSVGAAHPYGIRIDIQRLGDSSKPLETTVGISAACAIVATAAA